MGRCEGSSELDFCTIASLKSIRCRPNQQNRRGKPTCFVMNLTWKNGLEMTQPCYSFDSETQANGCFSFATQRREMQEMRKAFHVANIQKDFRIKLFNVNSVPGDLLDC